MAEIEPGHFVSISIPLGDAKFVMEGSRAAAGAGQAPILMKILIYMGNFPLYWDFVHFMLHYFTVSKPYNVGQI